MAARKQDIGTYCIIQQGRHRQVCAYRQSLPSSPAQSMDVDEGSDQQLNSIFLDTSAWAFMIGLNENVIST